MHMPLHKKSSIRNKIIIWTVIAIIAVLMIVSFPAAQNVTEIVLYP